ncbi:competence protein CoiA family protein [Paenactinomyces guangxiensis]|uniref:Competence protein CoiA-like N-terminal domain-containing protein n=1 Tax=Paenactinomyces guangxiensis TaxID=1490290 RepID=A0A7W1WNT7_9BACL|nr:competence protein CoiA family protein [Paenactinomyces guangxiensis]MBA4493226.1 hypothetical protein [Paenactinomyces guangxiensis]MBH8589924.1 hypothetical protein [Paenactinomyces guangxiensis]
MKIRPKYRKKYGLIPYALNQLEQAVMPNAANHRESYRCPECKRPVMLRTSKLKRKFFAHRVKRYCKLERSSSVLAKHVLRLTFEQWLKGKGDPIEVSHFCQSRQSIPREEIAYVKINSSMSSPLAAADLVLFDNFDVPFRAFSFDHRNRSVSPIAVMELSSEEVLSNPYLLSPLYPNSQTPPFKSDSGPEQLSLSLFSSD